jgi:hypothetical protein
MNRHISAEERSLISLKEGEQMNRQSNYSSLKFNEQLKRHCLAIQFILYCIFLIMCNSTDK